MIEAATTIGVSRVFTGKLHRVQRGHGHAFTNEPPPPPP